MFIKHTKSISPTSGKVVDTEVIEKNGKVYLIKEGEEYLIENNADFYKMMVKEYPEKQMPSTHIGMYFSGKCNMNCPFCYEKGRRELTLDDIKSIADKYYGKPMVLGGLEPTLREDLFEAIEIIKEKNYPFLATNGLKLADYEYSKKLKKAGLWCCILAFNGWGDNPLKLKALENLKRVGQRTMMSVMITRGANENQIKKIYDYCMENRDFITELRFRVQIPTKRNPNTKTYCMSELVDLMAGYLGIANEDIMAEYLFKEEILKALKDSKNRYARTIKNYFRSRLCQFYFTLNKGIPVGSKINILKARRSRFWLVYYLFRAYGLRHILEKFMFPFIELPNWLKNKDMLQILLRRWADIYTIDLERNKECVFKYYRGDQVLPFCYSMCIE